MTVNPWRPVAGPVDFEPDPESAIKPAINLGDDPGQFVPCAVIRYRFGKAHYLPGCRDHSSHEPEGGQAGKMPPFRP